LAWVHHVIIATEQYCDIGIGRWRRDEDLLYAATPMCLRPSRIGKPAGGFDHHLDIEPWPIDRGRLRRREDLDRLCTDAKGVAIGPHLLGAWAERRIILQQVRQGLRVR